MNWATFGPQVFWTLTFFWILSLLHYIIRVLMRGWLSRKENQVTMYYQALKLLTDPEKQVNLLADSDAELDEGAIEKRAEGFFEKVAKRYRCLIPFMAFVYYWPVGVLFYKKKILAAYNKGILLLEQNSNPPLWQHILRGRAPKNVALSMAEIEGFLKVLSLVARL